MELTWRASVGASSLHAAVCVADGRALADRRLAEVMEPPTRLLVDELVAAGLPPRETLAVFYALAASGVDNNRRLVEQSLTKLLGADKVVEDAVNRLTGRVKDLEQAMLRFGRPTIDQTRGRDAELVEELVLRGRPLTEQWAARGPGLLRTLARMTEEELLAEQAAVVLVYPATGGDGAAHLRVNAVTFEAVLANPHDDLPETLRLGWLLAQLNMDLPRYADAVPGERLAVLAVQAAVPAVLAAAQEVELARLDQTTIERALVVWRAASSDAAPAMAETLLGWWTTYDARPTPWAVALAALAQMLPAW